MADEMKRDHQEKPARKEKVQLSPEQLSKADDTLKTHIQSDAGRNIKGVLNAIKEERRENLSIEEKLNLAQVLKLVADSLDPEKSSNVEWSQLELREERLQKSLNNGIGQMLKRLRPMEQALNQLMLWKENSLYAGDKPMPKKKATVLFTPGNLSNPTLRKIVNLELAQTNQKIGRGKYRSFLFLPVEHLEDPADFVNYLRIAQKHYIHILSNLHVDDTLDSKYKLFGKWKYPINSINDTESQEILSNASFIANHLKVRENYSEYHESVPLSVGLEYAMAAQMTRYYDRAKPGNWYVPVVHPNILGNKLKTVNVIETVDNLDECNENQINFAYTTDKAEEADLAGVRIKGATTIFPKNAVNIKDAGTHAVPLIDSQARYTKNRIYFYLVTECYREESGQITKQEMRQKIQNYLNEMQSKKQIEGGSVVACEKDDLGNFSIKVGITWNAAAKDFEIDFNQAAEEGEK